MNFQLLREQLDAVPGLSVSERGTGKAKFLYVCSSSRAVEVAETAKGIWIEYWDDTDKEDEKRVNEEIVPAESEALAKIEDWLVSGTE
jgi:hypothetical protein